MCSPMPVVSWAAAQRGRYCDRHLQSGLLSTSCRGDSFCFSKWRNTLNSKKHCTGISLCSSVRVWQLLPPKICLSATVFNFPMGTPPLGSAHLLSPPRSCFWPWITDAQRGYPELHGPGMGREPCSCGTLHGPTEL